METDSFTEVYRTYFPAAARLARSLTRDAHAGDDIAAEGLLRVWRHWAGSWRISASARPHCASASPSVR